ncbi:hypothetical protein FIBSPDRAFT_366643 [Athelia psychrophila]|uniref:Uncharacterized protein n=1 Tax=Athelia psychrophila TaxID=1759441 RepID=A0A166P6I8_9AGAM|nr:hypothetical protein FIBSPDRAFT_366643 [Fibularhizoctonia sp. CBS 109695]
MSVSFRSKLFHYPMSIKNAAHFLLDAPPYLVPVIYYDKFLHMLPVPLHGIQHRSCFSSTWSNVLQEAVTDSPYVMECSIKKPGDALVIISSPSFLESSSGRNIGRVDGSLLFIDSQRLMPPLVICRGSRHYRSSNFEEEGFDSSNQAPSKSAPYNDRRPGKAMWLKNLQPL